MKDIQSLYQEALEVAETLPSKQASELIAAVSMVYATTLACQTSAEAMIEASAKPVTVAM